MKFINEEKGGDKKERMMTTRSRRFLVLLCRFRCFGCRLLCCLRLLLRFQLRCQR